MKIRWIAIITALLFSCTLGAQSIEINLPDTLDTLVQNYYQSSVTAAFGTFTYAYADLPSPFSRWLEDKLGSAISKSGRLKLFNRSVAAAMDPAFKSIYGDFFQKTGVDALITGHFNIEGNVVMVRLELTSLTDGTLIGTTDVRVPVAALPSGLQIQPLPQVQQFADTLSGVLPSTGLASDAAGRTNSGQQAQLTVTVSTDRGKGAVYKDGEDLVVLATVNQPAYIRIFHIDVNKKIQCIYPNRFGGGTGWINPGELVRIPGAVDPFAFRMGPPFGTEFIKVVASTKAFSSDDQDFTDLGDDARSIIANGIPISKESDIRYAEALASYVIVPAQ